MVDSKSVNIGPLIDFRVRTQQTAGPIDTLLGNAFLYVSWALLTTYIVITPAASSYAAWITSMQCSVCLQLVTI